MNDSIGRYCIINNRLEQVGALSQVSLLSSSVCYEVIRVVDGIFLFLEDHLRRLRDSVRNIRINYNIDYENLKEHLLKLQVKNMLSVGNVKILLSFSTDKPEIPTVTAYQIIHRYPDNKQYQTGIRASLFFMERERPNIKYINDYFQKKCKEEIRDRKVYEVLLVDHDNYVTEGSKSNVFLIREGNVYTSPENRVLKGITRDKVAGICKELKYNLIEENISINSLSQFEAAFLTGTSPKVLPIASIDGNKYHTDHPVIIHIKSQYDALIENYIARIKQLGYCFDIA